MVFRVPYMPKISEKIAFHLPTGISMLRRGVSPPLAPPLVIAKYPKVLEEETLALNSKL